MIALNMSTQTTIRVEAILLDGSKSVNNKFDKQGKTIRNFVYWVIVWGKIRFETYNYISQ